MDRGGSLPKIVSSYRRRDSEAMTGRIFDRLVAHYGRDAVFRDIDNIPPGIDFRAHIADALTHSDMVLAIIGPKWAGRSGRAGLARIDDENDFVRIEVETALQRGIPVIPVLLGDTKMPSADRVPDSLQDFVFRQAIRVDPGRDFEHHVDRLTTEIDRLLGRQLAVAAAEPAGGEQNVKNIARPVRVNALRAESIVDLPAPGVPPISPISQPTVAPRLSIVVLPFANLSNDPEQQYFADGITEDLTTDLSRIADLLVISRNTAFTYQGKRVDTKQIGRELCVRYVLEGSVRRSGDRVRVNAQLIDAEADAHLWAERFDSATSDLFALQDEVTSRIAVALNLELPGVAAARPTEQPDALDYILRARATWFKPLSPDRYAEAIDLYERALALDPQSVAAQSWLAVALAGRVINQMNDTPGADIARAEGLLTQALAASPRSVTVHFARGELLRAQRLYDEAIPEYETVLAFDRNSVSGLVALGHCKLMTGSIEDVIPLMERAIHLSPRDPQIAVMYYRIGEVHLLQSRIDKAIASLERARSANLELAYVRLFLASAYALKGETERAAAELGQARRLGDRLLSIADQRAGFFWVPKTRVLFEATYFTGLRKAGIPEE
jgi:TolB-like protein